MNELPQITLIGFGEAGCAFAQGWAELPVVIKVFDIKTQSVSTRPDLLDRYKNYAVTGCDLLEDAVNGSDAIFSFVTADQAHTAAKNVVGLSPKGTLFFDCNSCAPHTKQASSLLIEGDGGRYVDVAVMAPVHPGLHKTKVHICGPNTDAALSLMNDLAMNVTVLDGEIGVASATKMVRSIMMKGMEATMLECVLAGRKAGVDHLVLDSLDKTYPGFNFREKAAYMMERVMVHGIRRAAELREVALTVDHLGLDNGISRSTVEWQQKVGDLNLDPDYTLDAQDYGPRADNLLAALDNLNKSE